MSLTIEPIPLLTDNYAYLLRDEATQRIAIIDPAEAAPVLQFLKNRQIDYILNTHHHPDHTGGNEEIKKATGAKIYAPKKDQHRIPGFDYGLEEGDEFMLGGSKAKILEIPGHTSGHIAFWFEDDHALFVGDTLFSIGCGRLFEGSARQMWSSLLKLRTLPDDTRIYCGHEYTKANIEFALSIDRNNVELEAFYHLVCKRRSRGEPTIPSLLSLEKQLNPFLRADDSSLTDLLPILSNDPVEIFAYLRDCKDNF
jgi:hydroxyacylglutathione hydrolase